MHCQAPLSLPLSLPCSVSAGTPQFRAMLPCPAAACDQGSGASSCHGCEVCPCVQRSPAEVDQAARAVAECAVFNALLLSCPSWRLSRAHVVASPCHVPHTRSSTPGPKHSNTHSLCKTLRHRSAAPSRVACKAAATLPEILQKLVPSINGRSSMHRGSGPEYSKQVMEDESKYILQVCYSLLVMHVAVDAVGKWGNVQPTVHTSRHECGCVSARAISKSRA